MRFRLCLVAALLCLSAVAAVPETDARNTALPDYDTHFKMPEYTSRKQWEARKSRLRKQILSAAGLLPMPARPPLRTSIVKRTAYPGYSIEVVLLETFAGYRLGGNLYRPVGKKGPFPAILVPHGHWKHGRLENRESYSVPALCVNLARQGYVAFAYDMVGFNDTRQTSHSFGGKAEALWALNPMGLQLWNSLRAVDFLQSLTDVDSRRIGATGASGGATQTFLLTAVEDRIKVAAPVNMVSAYMQGGDPCEEAPNLRLHTFNVEITAMAAPRPMLLVSSTRDWTRHTPREEFPAIRHIYDLYGVSQNIESAHIDAEHNYNRQSREAVYRFLASRLQLRLSPAELQDREFEMPADDDLLAYPAGKLPPNAGGLPELFDTWKVTSRLQTEGKIDLQELREGLSFTLNAVWPRGIESVISNDRIVMSRVGQGDRVTGSWLPGKGTAVLLVDPEGSEAAMRTPLAKEIVRSGRPVLAIDPFRSDTERVRKAAYDRYFLSYNQTEAANRVQDILTALSFLKAHDRGKPELIGLGEAGIWCLFAAAVAPAEMDVVADLNGFGGSDEDFLQRFFVPGIQRAGGLSAALRLVNRFRAAIPASPHVISVAAARSEN